jgi:pyruvate dehydrogenase E1 component alpha subunit
MTQLDIGNTEMALSETYENEFLLKLLEEMVLIRRFEEKASQCYGLRKIGGFCHLYIGQEAVCVGAFATLDMTKDYVYTTYRDHGHAISAGMNCDVIMAELFGKADGCSRGKGGSMHLFDKQKHFFGGHGIVGAHIPLATGTAFKIKYMKEDGVVLCFFGDGAIHNGAFHESMNLARIWKLPVLFICENNQYGMGTDFRRVSSVEDFSVKAAGYDMPGRQVDGMDVLKVYEEVKEAVELAREESMPSLLEIKTYRYVGHSMSDPATYRSKDEVSEYKEQDPILILKNKMLKDDSVTEKAYKTIDDRCKQIAEDSVKFAEQSQNPEMDTMYEDVLSAD